jgi:hypothetical protein
MFITKKKHQRIIEQYKQLFKETLLSEMKAKDNFHKEVVDHIHREYMEVIKQYEHQLRRVSR